MVHAYFKTDKYMRMTHYHFPLMNSEVLAKPLRFYLSVLKMVFKDINLNIANASSKGTRPDRESLVKAKCYIP